MDKLKPIILDDSVEYRVYFANSPVDEDFALATLSSLSSKLKQLSSGWLWHCEEFSLELVKAKVSEDERSSIPAHLYGVTHFGDNLDDEWLIVYMLLEASKTFTDLVVSIEDSDGQFLLIETANALPRWLTPERAENRIFLHKGQLHIIPEARHPGEVGVYPVGTPRISEAIQLISNGTFSTEADAAVQDLLSAKLAIFPDHIHKSRHIAQCVLPVSAAHVLTHDPTLVASAVQTFYGRDPLQMRSCRNMKHFAPGRPEDNLCVNTAFTKCLYAQLRQQRYRPGVKSGWQMPPPSDPQFVSHDLGMKLSYGLEILRKQAPKSAGETSNTAEQDISDQCIGPRWDKFLSSLQARDYFRGEMEGSKEHQRLTAEAKQYYSSQLAREDAPSTEVVRRSTEVGRRVQHILDNVPMDVEKLRQASAHVKPADSEDWMSIDQQELDKLLQQYHFGSDPSAASPAAAADSAAHHPSQAGQRYQPSVEPGEEQLKTLIDSMKQFVSGVAGPEGAEFPTSSTGAVNFTADGFASAISSLLGGNHDKDGSDSDCDLADDLDIGDFDDDDDEFEEGSEASEMKSYVDEMDHQLAQTDLGGSFERAQAHASAGGSSDLPPVDIDMNLVKNLLASYSAQDGLAGPAGNILHGMGLQMPQRDPSSST
eukprot:scpid43635/ scgid32814/ Protein SGT1; Protein ecdysoneless homolog; Suppressor of GCR2